MQTLREPIDTLRVAVHHFEEDEADTGSDGFAVHIFVNGEEMTESGAGLGMDPYRLLVPVNHLRAGDRPTLVPVAQCLCGVYGCGMTDVYIKRVGDRVHWTWEVEVPMDRSVVFAADAYDAEMARVEADHAWETPERRAGRLVHEAVDRAHLAEHDLTIHWLGDDALGSADFPICLRLGRSHYLHIGVPREDRAPEELAAAVVTELARPPQAWAAGWQAVGVNHQEAPAIAGPRWWHGGPG